MNLQQNIINIVNQYLDNNNTIEAEVTFALKSLAQYEEEVTLFQSDSKALMKLWQQRKDEQVMSIITESNIINLPSSKSNLDNIEIPTNSIAVVTVSGMMRSESGLCHNGMDLTANQIQSAFQNDNIDAVIVKMSTGGGETAAGSRLQATLQDAPKPVVVYTDTLLASAGVRGAITATNIIASEGAQIGSIGTYTTLPKGFAEQYKQYYTDVYADASGNKNKSFRAFIEGDLSVMRSEINRVNNQFLAEVKKNRALKGSNKDINHTLSGEMFTAQEALRRGLIDAVGSFQYAISKTKELVAQKKQ